MVIKTKIKPARNAYKTKKVFAFFPVYVMSRKDSGYFGVNYLIWLDWYEKDFRYLDGCWYHNGSYLKDSK